MKPRLISCIYAFDEATRWAYPHIIKVREFAESKGYVTYRCEGEYACRTCVLDAFRREEYVTIFLCLTHGEEDKLLDMHGNAIISVDTIDPSMVKENRIYLVYACHSAKVLGPTLVNLGAKAYWGWRDWAFVGKPGTPSEKLQEAVKDAWVMFLNGASLEEAFNHAHKVWCHEAVRAATHLDLHLANVFLKQSANNVLIVKEESDVKYRLPESALLLTAYSFITIPAVILALKYIMENIKI